MQAKHWKNKLIDFAILHISYFWTILRWTLYALFTGVVCGVIGVGFDKLLEFAADTFGRSPWLVILLPAAGLVIAGLYKLCRVDRDNGFEMVLESVKKKEKVPYLCAPLVFLCTGITNLFGGSSGREGAALQIGGTVGTFFGRALRFPAKETNIMALCGMAALFSAVFGTPVTAAVLSVEIVSMDSVYYMAFFPCILSALIAFQISVLCGITPTPKRFGTVAIPEFDALNVIRVLGAALIFSVAIILFVSAVKYSGRLFSRLLKSPFLRIAASGLLLALLTGGVYLATGQLDYNGAGMTQAVAAVSGTARPEAFLLKILFTALTLGAGFKGGKIVPAFFVGATLGCTVAPILGLDAGFCAALGMIALFSGMDNCPLAAIALSVELFGHNFGAEGFIYFAVVCGASYMLTGYFSLYAGRAHVYNLLHMDYVRKIRGKSGHTSHSAPREAHVGTAGDNMPTDSDHAPSAPPSQKEDPHDSAL